MKIRSAEFVLGAAQPAQFPRSVLPEVAFAGKSNVGKSSLINSLLSRKHLVKTSATPGKTRQINFFLINEEFMLVDLPGYGYSTAPKAEQAAWRGLVERYVTSRAPLRGLVWILDSRHDPTALDVQLGQWLTALGRPALVVASKVDKLTKAELPRHLQAVAAALGLPEPPLAYSSKSGIGKDALWRALAPWLAP